MTTRAIAWRLCLASFAAAVLAALLIVFSPEARADSCEGADPGEHCAVVYWPGICSYLEPGSFWHRHFNCDNPEVGGLMATSETVEYHDLPDGRRLVEIIREFPGGQRSTVIREMKGR